MKENLLLSAKGIEKSFGKNNVLKGIDFSINTNERVALVGGNGAGKTTFLNIISGNDKNFSGKITTDLKKKDMSFQFQTTNYPDEFTVFDLLYIFERKIKEDKDKKKEQDSVSRMDYLKNIVKKIKVGDFKDLTDSTIKNNVIDKLKSMNLIKQRNSKPSDLSGGQMQKLNLLLTMASNPKLVFFDEILSGLDQPSIDDIFNFSNEYIKDKVTAITISHNANEIFSLCDRIIYLLDGKIIINKKISEYKNIEELENEMKKNIIEENKIDYKSIMQTEKNFEYVNDEFLNITNIKKNYGLNHVLIGENQEGINLNIYKGQRVAIIGKNGSGKSTLAEIIAGVKKSNSGNVKLRVFENNNKHGKKSLKYYKKHEEIEKQLKAKGFKDNKKEIIAKIKPLEKEKKLILARIKKDDYSITDDLKPKVKKLFKKIEKAKEIGEKKNKELPLVNVQSLLNLYIRSLDKEIYIINNTLSKKEILQSESNKYKVKYHSRYLECIKYNNKHRSNVIGIQFQKQFYPSNLNLRDVVIFHLKANHIEYNEQYVELLLETISLKRHMYNTTFEISGGQRQKLNILLNIITQPSLIIFDELTTGLDVLAKEKLLNLIREYLDKTNATLFMVTHSKEDIEKLAERVVVLKDGTIINDLPYNNEVNLDELLRDI